MAREKSMPLVDKMTLALPNRLRLMKLMPGAKIVR
jgi:hypothetical protein